MFNRHNIIILVLGVVLSFALFAQGEIYHTNSVEYGRMLQDCAAQNFRCEYRYVNKQDEFEKQFGASYWVLSEKFKRRRAYYIIPVLILIVTLFVSFAVDREELPLTMMVLTPLILTFMIKFIFGPECCLTPFYLLFAAVAASLSARLKRRLFIKTP